MMDTSYQSVKMKNLYFTGGNGCWTPDLCTIFLQKMADFSRNVSVLVMIFHEYFMTFESIASIHHIFHELHTFHISFPLQVPWRMAATTAARLGASFMASGHDQCLVGHGVVHDKHIVTPKLEA